MVRWDDTYDFVIVGRPWVTTLSDAWVSEVTP